MIIRSETEEMELDALNSSKHFRELILYLHDIKKELMMKKAGDLLYEGMITNLPDNARVIFSHKENNALHLNIRYKDDDFEEDDTLGGWNFILNVFYKKLDSPILITDIINRLYLFNCELENGKNEHMEDEEEIPNIIEENSDNTAKYNINQIKVFITIILFVFSLIFYYIL